MSRLLLVAALALGLASSASANGSIHFSVTSGCGGNCTYYDYDASAGVYSGSISGIVNNGYSYPYTVPPSGHSHQGWVQKPTTPAGCYLVSRVASWVYNFNVTHEIGVLNPVNKSCAGLASLPTRSVQMVRGSQVGDGGSALPACTPGLVGSVFYSAGHYWRCTAAPYRMVIVG